MVDAHGEVLKCIIIVGGVEFQTRAVVGEQVHIGRHSVFLAKSDVIVLVEVESAVSYDWVKGLEVYDEAVVAHCRLQS